MKFIASSSQLLRQLQILGGVINNNNTLPILDNFLFELKQNELIISASDFITLKWENIRVEHLVYVTAKNKKTIKLPLFPELKEVLNEFRDLSKSEYILGALTGKETADEVIVREKTITKNQNKYLKLIAQDLSIEKKEGYTFSTHSARSTLLTLASEFEDIEYLKRIAAHSSSKTTEGYISVDVAPEEEERTLKLYKNLLAEPSLKMKIAN